MLELKNIEKRYDYKKVLHRINMELPECGLIGIAGPSGCGKSTLLSILGGLDNEYGGELIYNGKSVRRNMTSYRRNHVSFIFQKIHLIHWLSPTNNVRISQYFKNLYLGHTHKEECLWKHVSHLSHGQRGILSYLRAFYYDKDIILADEPTGAMDMKNANELMCNLKELSQDRLIVVVSHNMQLIEEYCDEIYMMKDGYIAEHIIKNRVECRQREKQKNHKSLFMLLRLSLSSLLSHKKRTLQMISGVFLSMLCILSTLTLSFNLKNHLSQYIHSLIPSSMISFYSPEPIENKFILDIKQKDKVKRVHLFADDCELLGLSFDKEKYKYSSTLFITEDSSPFEDIPLQTGKYPQHNNEIILSLSTAKHLTNGHVDNLLNKSICGWYKLHDEMIGLQYKIVGITSLNTQTDMFYQMDNAYLSLMKERGVDVNTSYGVIYVENDTFRSEFVNTLQKEYKSMEFKESGKSTIEKMEGVFDKIELVLFVLSVMMISSSVLMLGEVTYLNVILKRKDYAIMKCFGASTFDLLKIVVIETMEILFVSFLFVVSLYYVFIYSINLLFKEILLMDNLVILASIHHVVIVLVSGFLIMLISQVMTMLYMVRLNTTEVLKE